MDKDFLIHQNSNGGGIYLPFYKGETMLLGQPKAYWFGFIIGNSWKKLIKVQGRAKIAFSVYCKGPYRNTQNQNPPIKFSLSTACGETLKSNLLHNYT